MSCSKMIKGFDAPFVGFFSKSAAPRLLFELAAII